MKKPKEERFPVDSLLRRHGWQIAARPREGEAMWRYRRFKPVPQSRALERIIKEFGWVRHGDVWIHSTGMEATAVWQAVETVLELEAARPEGME